MGGGNGVLLLVLHYKGLWKYLVKMLAKYLAAFLCAAGEVHNNDKLVMYFLLDHSTH